MALTLIVLTGDPATEQPLTVDGPRLFVGRAETCELRLPDPSVSLRHASFRQRGSDYLIVDEGSTNGTFVGPVRLTPQAPRVVRNGDHLRFGRVWVCAHVEAVPATTQSTLITKELALRLVSRAMAATGDSTVARIVIRKGIDQGNELALEVPEKRYVLGRSTNCDLLLEEENASRRHIEVFTRNGQVILRDLGSKNGSCLAGMPLSAGSETLWTPGNHLVIGGDEIELLDPVSEALRDLERAADEIMPSDEEVPLPSTRSVKVLAVTPERPLSSPPNKGNSSPPTRPAGPARGSPRPTPTDGVTKADMMVGFLAVLVFALSALGLYWLLGSH